MSDLSRKIFSLNAAAEYSGYSRAVVEYWLDSGLLPFEEVPTPGQKNRCRRIRKADLDAFLEGHLKKNHAPARPKLKTESLILLDR
ncbi:helix-turn-helix domain-containing protein [bacterium]|nr:helix-turn-helix domain-containing protein [bacterium]